MASSALDYSVRQLVDCVISSGLPPSRALVQNLGCGIVLGLRIGCNRRGVLVSLEAEMVRLLATRASSLREGGESFGTFILSGIGHGIARYELVIGLSIGCDPISSKIAAADDRSAGARGHRGFRGQTK